MKLDFNPVSPNPGQRNGCSVAYLNAVKSSIVESRTLLDKILDFFTPNDQVIAKFTAQFHAALISQVHTGFASLRQVDFDSVNGYTYEIVNSKGETLLFTSRSACENSSDFARGLIVAAADDKTIRPDIKCSNEESECIFFMNGDSYGLNLSPLDDYGNYYMDKDNGVLLVNASVQGEGDQRNDFDALAAMACFRLKPVLVNIKQNENDELCFQPKNEEIKYNGSVIMCNSNALDSFVYEACCDIRDLYNALDFVSKRTEASGNTTNFVTVNGFDADTVGIFANIARQKGNILEAEPGNPCIIVRHFLSDGRMITILFSDVSVTPETQDVLHGVANVVYHNSVFALEWGYEQLCYSIIAEQIFDSDEFGSAEEKSIKLASALMQQNEEIKFIESGNSDDSLRFSDSDISDSDISDSDISDSDVSYSLSLILNGVPYPVSFDKEGERRGKLVEHALANDNKGNEFLWKEDFIRSLSWTKYNKYATELMTGNPVLKPHVSRQSAIIA